MMNKNKYKILVTKCKSKHLEDNAQYINYKNSINNYEIYFKDALNTIKENKLIVLFLESGPHSLSNYIFNNTNFKINYASDKFLWNICVGFDIKPAGLTKDECLKQLFSRSKYPVLIIDLFPFHGINLSVPKSNPIRKEIYKNLKADKTLLMNALNDPINYLKDLKGNKVFLFGVPCSFWNSFGGAGKGSICLTDLANTCGPLGPYINKTNIVNVGGQTISSNAIKAWRNAEKV